MGGRSSLPTAGEHLDSDFSGPLSLLWSPCLELGAANQILVFNSVLTQNYQSVISAQIAVFRVKLLQQSTQNTSLLFFPLSSMKFLNNIHLNEFFLE